ncbi:HDOD domain-containing protein [Pseudomonas sp. CFBP 8771]|nr:HDOD domain-containing protein [Pseudomonas sp. CFBP 8771]MBD8731987.1 HDOD domain-containing protein [Pseudomonas sp. CFBP 13710]
MRISIVSNAKPQTLDTWLALLDGVRLPIPRLYHDKVRAAIKDRRRSLRDIADLMQHSPALVLSVMREANRHASNSLAEPAESLEVALNRLGLSRAEELLMRLPALDPQQMPLTLRQLQMISQHASQQANGLFAARLARLWQEIHWGSLLFLSPLWPLAATYPELLDEWEHRVIAEGEAAATVEQALFGVPLLVLCQALAQKWRLPAWVLHGYRLLLGERRALVQALHIARDNQHRLRQQQQLDDEPALRRWLNQPANTILMANGLALAAQHGWFTPHLQRWQYLSCLYLQVPLEQVQQQVHQHAVHSARVHWATDLWHPARSLPWPPQHAPATQDSEPAPAPSEAALAGWRHLCTQLLATPTPFNNALHLTTCARDALLACGMQRVMLLMVDRSHGSLRVHQSAGLPKEAAALSLGIEHSSLLQRLLAQPTQLRMGSANSAQLQALLPATLRALFRGEHVLLRSLGVEGRVHTLLVADQGGRPFSEISVQGFGKTAQCIERALDTFTNRSR